MCCSNSFEGGRQPWVLLAFGAVGLVALAGCEQTYPDSVELLDGGCPAGGKVVSVTTARAVTTGYLGGEPVSVMGEFSYAPAESISPERVCGTIVPYGVGPANLPQGSKKYATVDMNLPGVVTQVFMSSR